MDLMCNQWWIYRGEIGIRKNLNDNYIIFFWFGEKKPENFSIVILLTLSFKYRDKLASCCEFWF